MDHMSWMNQNLCCNVWQPNLTVCAEDPATHVTTIKATLVLMVSSTSLTRTNAGAGMFSKWRTSTHGATVFQSTWNFPVAITGAGAMVHTAISSELGLATEDNRCHEEYGLRKARKG
eukprot:TRINITY_DN67705_c0_g1_i1.p2 TRINITY_DN67705_c0_g1~~TRINITY_DN67705_c0_g1_i1.p2  ORF type:complete len:117 (+),score=5.81 TRINITY_DN67705_c0_g1_i1:82-432(+)